MTSRRTLLSTKTLTSHHLEQLICRKFACAPPTQSLDERASSTRGFYRLKQPQLSAIRSRDKLHFRIRQQTETLAQILWNGHLTLGGNFHCFLFLQCLLLHDKRNHNRPVERCFSEG